MLLFPLKFRRDLLSLLSPIVVMGIFLKVVVDIFVGFSSFFTCLYYSFVTKIFYLLKKVSFLLLLSMRLVVST